MKPSAKKTIKFSLLSTLFFVLLFINLYFIQSSDLFGSAAFFAAGLIMQFVLFVSFVYCLISALHKPLHIIKSILLSAWDGMQTNEYIRRFKRSKHSLPAWSMARLDPHSPTGLAMTCGAILAALCFIGFLFVLKNVMQHSTLVTIDQRVLNLVPSLRTPAQNAFFIAITFLASPQMTVVLVGVSSLVLWLSRQRFAAAILVLATLTEELLSLLVKNTVARPRPARYLGLIKETSFSFPSGHTLVATVVFGLLAYFIYTRIRSTLVRLCIILTYLLLVIMVALSRIYLGVHYPSDVLGSVLLGGSILVLAITAMEIMARYHILHLSYRQFANNWLIGVFALALLLTVPGSQLFIKPSPVAAPHHIAVLPTIDSTTVLRLPLYSETLSASKMEPINFIYLGSRLQIEHAFLERGWYEADPSNLQNTLKAFAAGLQSKQYLNAPVTPAFLGGKPEDLAFEQPTKGNTLRQRHHTRIWQTNYVLPSGQPIWVATASYDEGVELAGAFRLPTHHIDPNIDAERQHIIDSLGLQSSATYIQVVAPTAGQNAAGDIFFTDGKAAIVRF